MVFTQSFHILQLVESLLLLDIAWACVFLGGYVLGESLLYGEINGRVFGLGGGLEAPGEVGAEERERVSTHARLLSARETG